MPEDINTYTQGKKLLDQVEADLKQDKLVPYDQLKAYLNMHGVTKLCDQYSVVFMAISWSLRPIVLPADSPELGQFLSLHRRAFQSLRDCLRKLRVELQEENALEHARWKATYGADEAEWTAREAQWDLLEAEEAEVLRLIAARDV